jgi:hypothetical protein
MSALDDLAIGDMAMVIWLLLFWLVVIWLLSMWGLRVIVKCLSPRVLTGNLVTARPMD